MLSLLVQLLTQRDWVEIGNAPPLAVINSYTQIGMEKSPK